LTRRALAVGQSLPAKSLHGRLGPVADRDRPLLLGEWACLGIIAEATAHAYAVSVRLAPDGDVGRIWSLSRPLTYRAVDHLRAVGFIRELRSEQGIAGGMRTPLSITANGKRALHRWLASPVPHLREVRSALLVKLQLCENLGVNRAPLLAAQRAVFTELIASQRGEAHRSDPVAVWRREFSSAVMRFLEQLERSDR
jgi:DNA-binding PadR family transcriptional regulator